MPQEHPSLTRCKYAVLITVTTTSCALVEGVRAVQRLVRALRARPADVVNIERYRRHWLAADDDGAP